MTIFISILFHSIIQERNVLCAQSFSGVQLFSALWTIACQTPLRTGFSRKEYWSGLPCPPPEDLLDPGIEPDPLVSLAWRQILYPLSYLEVLLKEQNWALKVEHKCATLASIGHSRLNTCILLKPQQNNKKDVKAELSNNDKWNKREMTSDKTYQQSVMWKADGQGQPRWQASWG